MHVNVWMWACQWVINDASGCVIIINILTGTTTTKQHSSLLSFSKGRQSQKQ